MRCTKTQSFFSFAAVIAFSSAAPTSVTAGPEPFIGEINYVAFNFAPRNWAFCNGQLLSINDNTALFSLLGTEYGGDGRTTFGLPDMRGRVPIHQGRAPGGSNYAMGQMGGSERIIQTIDQMPVHSHGATAVSTSTSEVAPGASATSTLKAVNSDPNITTAQGNSLANGGRTNLYSSSAPNVSMHANSIETSLSGVSINTTTVTAVTVDNTGGQNSFSVMQPYTTVNCIIALQGTYPQRQ